MERIPLLSQREGLTERQLAIFDWVVDSRGEMIRPYEVLLHAPGLARPAAELGHQIRYEGELSDHDRELAIITAAKAHDCGFEWDSHVHLARGAGVSETAIEALQSGESAFTESEAVIVTFVQELCAESDVSDSRVTEVSEHLGGHGPVVELAGLVGYYTFLAYVMKVAGVC